MVLTHISVALKEHFLGDVAILLPREWFEALLAARLDRSRMEPLPRGEGFGALLSDVEMELSVNLASWRMDVRQLLDLKPNDILPLNGATAVGLVEGVARFSGVAGNSNGHRSFCVSRVAGEQE